jgi:hypothetical protein
MPPLGSAVSQEMDIAANTLRGITVMTPAVCPARCLDVKTLGVDR